MDRAHPRGLPLSPGPRSGPGAQGLHEHPDEHHRGGRRSDTTREDLLGGPLVYCGAGVSAPAWGTTPRPCAVDCRPRRDGLTRGLRDILTSVYFSLTQVSFRCSTKGMVNHGRQPRSQVTPWPLPTEHLTELCAPARRSGDPGRKHDWLSTPHGVGREQAGPKPRARSAEGTGQ